MERNRLDDIEEITKNVFEVGTVVDMNILLGKVVHVSLGRWFRWCTLLWVSGLGGALFTG